MKNQKLVFKSSIKENPLHIMLGLFQIAIGIHLVLSDQYFIWPPVLSGIANDDIFGGAFVVLGTLLLYWVIDFNRSVRFDHALLIVSAFMMTFLTCLQLAHFIKLGIDMPWISNAALTVVVFYLAKRSDSGSASL
ncbi:hypothetical protein GPK34_02125 [Secundilactobacillus kimchicus]|nr:hypothetical protein [Secundilactobacillus kimchicus]MBT9670835.1 hypothetical protein [Secundilactobacillus kimchicus]